MNIIKWAQEAGKATGFATTARITHATPGALYASVADRDYECDSEIPEEEKKLVVDVASQLIFNDPGMNIKVMLGGGQQAFLPPKSLHPINYFGEETWSCYRQDGQNLVQKWLDQKGSDGKYVDTVDDLIKFDPNDADYLLGLFAPSHIPYIDNRDTNIHPTLKDLTSKALDVLERSENGYFLMVEGSRIDMAHHETWANRALNEVMEFDETIEAVLDRIDTEETLVIVTADHSHTFSLSGYSDRGSDIRGLGNNLADDDLPYTMFGYANGPSFYEHFKVSEDGKLLCCSEIYVKTL